VFGCRCAICSEAERSYQHERYLIRKTKKRQQKLSLINNAQRMKTPGYRAWATTEVEFFWPQQTNDVYVITQKQGAN
jgi:hypothetical protein